MARGSVRATRRRQKMVFPNGFPSRFVIGADLAVSRSLTKISDEVNVSLKMNGLGLTMLLGMASKKRVVEGL